MSDERARKRSESDDRAAADVVAHLYLGDGPGEDDPEKKKKRAAERPEDDFAKKKKKK